MIKNIQSLKGFGVFRDYKNGATKDFGQYNLIYGLNGSGKSTLSHVLRCIENNHPSEKFTSSEFTVSVAGSTPITQANVSQSDVNIHTFNREFIDANISWDTIVKSILLVDEEKIDERKKLEALKDEQKEDKTIRDKKIVDKNTIDKQVSDFESKTAKLIKESLRYIDTTDLYYFNYNKGRLKSFIKENLSADKSDAPLLEPQELVALTSAAKPNQKQHIVFTQPNIDLDTFADDKPRLDDLLNTSVVSETIQRLVNDTELETWVHAGLTLHKKEDASNCEFCGNTIGSDRIKELEAHFNDSYNYLQTTIQREVHRLESEQFILPALPLGSDFYEEFKSEYSEAIALMGSAYKALQDELSAWCKVLGEKLANLHASNLQVTDISAETIEQVMQAINAVSVVVNKHNNKTDNFEKETAKAKKRLELHYTVVEAKKFKYHDKIKDADNLERIVLELADKVNKRASYVLEIESSLSNESLGANEFNVSLHKFLGRSDLALRFNRAKKGYEILRNQSEQVDNNLSERRKDSNSFRLLHN